MLMQICTQSLAMKLNMPSRAWNYKYYSAVVNKRFIISHLSTSPGMEQLSNAELMSRGTSVCGEDTINGSIPTVAASTLASSHSHNK